MKAAFGLGGSAVRVSEVAIHTVREAVRDRIFLVSILFAGALLAATLLLTPLATGQRDKLVQDLGLGAIAGTGLLLAIFIGTGMVYREIERRTIHTVLARPIGCGEYVVGKYFCIVATISLNLAVMFLLYGAVVHFYLDRFHVELLAAAYLIGVELAVIAAFSIFFSVVASPFLGAFFTLLFFMVGHLTRDILAFSELVPEGFGRIAIQASSYILPNLELFNIKGMAVYGKPVTMEYIGLTSLYGLLYATAIVMISVIIFQRRDLR